MAKRKREINFIASQRLMGKTKQSTSFEFILVVTVIVVACGMVGWYLYARTANAAALAEKQAAQAELESAKKQKEDNEKRFNFYQVKTDENGNQIIQSVKPDGTVIYKYDSLNDVAKEVATNLAEVQSASADIKGIIDLTSIIFVIIDTGTKNIDGCELLSFSFTGTGTKVSINLESATQDGKLDYFRFMQGKDDLGTSISPTKYITGAAMSGESTVDGKYRFTISFTINSDALYDGDKEAA